MCLQVYPFAGIAEAAPPNVPRLLFNRDPAGSFVDNPRKNDAVADGISRLFLFYFFFIYMELYVIQVLSYSTV